VWSDTLMRVAMTRWLTVLWSAQAKVEGIVLKAAWYWGSDSSVVNNPLGKPGHTPLYIGLLSTWDSMNGDHMFPVFHGRAPYWDSDGYK
jgi:hypothetical protein